MSVTRIGINGFGRMGRLALRAGWDNPELEFCHINEIKGDAATAAHLLEFDSVHGRWGRDPQATADELSIEGSAISFGGEASPGDVDWGERGVDVVLECPGKFRSRESLTPYFEREIGRASCRARVCQYV